VHRCASEASVEICWLRRHAGAVSEETPLCEQGRRPLVRCLDKTLVEWLHGYSADKKQQIQNKSLLKKYFTCCIGTKVDFFPLIRWFWADPILITFKGQIF
jgi:hypothetical protein